MPDYNKITERVSTVETAAAAKPNLTSSAAVANTGASPAVGVGTTAARADHNHGAATELKTATTQVAIGSATAPVAGQVLTATGPSAAAWQTPASGVGSIPLSYYSLSSLNASNIGVGTGNNNSLQGNASMFSRTDGTNIWAIVAPGVGSNRIIRINTSTGAITSLNTPSLFAGGSSISWTQLTMSSDMSTIYAMCVEITGGSSHSWRIYKINASTMTIVENTTTISSGSAASSVNDIGLAVGPSQIGLLRAFSGGVYAFWFNTSTGMANTVNGTLILSGGGDTSFGSSPTSPFGNGGFARQGTEYLFAFANAANNTVSLYSLTEGGTTPTTVANLTSFLSGGSGAGYSWFVTSNDQQTMVAVGTSSGLGSFTRKGTTTRFFEGLILHACVGNSKAVGAMSFSGAPAMSVVDHDANTGRIQFVPLPFPGGAGYPAMIGAGQSGATKIAFTHRGFTTYNVNSFFAGVVDGLAS